MTRPAASNAKDALEDLDADFHSLLTTLVIQRRIVTIREEKRDGEENESRFSPMS